jgi:hypothetical protein
MATQSPTPAEMLEFLKRTNLVNLELPVSGQLNIGTILENAHTLGDLDWGCLFGSGYVLIYKTEVQKAKPVLKEE